MKKLFLLFLLPTILSIGQVINFDDASKWTQGSGPFDTYQNDHKYNDQINGYDVEFTGDLVLRENAGTEDGFPATHNNSAYSWNLKEGAATSLTATVYATQISGFSFYMRQQDGTPAPKYVVQLFIPESDIWEVIAILTPDNFFGNDSDWKLYSNTRTLTVPESVGKISIMITPWGYLGPVDGVFIDDFAFDNPLPVELTTFTAAVVGENVKLNWETATELNNYGFEVERQNVKLNNENSEWENIGFIEGHGNSNSVNHYSFTDNSIVSPGQYNYRLKQIDIGGSFEYSDIVEVNYGLTRSFELNQNYPNPFNPTTDISFNLPTDAHVTLTIFNVLGEQVAQIVNGNISAGYHSVTFDAGKLNSGIYYYKLEADGFIQMRKMMLLK